MKKLLSLIITAAIGAGLMYGALSHHFILLDDQLKILKKTRLTLHNTYVDARGAKVFNLVTQPDLVAAGLADLLSGRRGLSIPLFK
ncbi:MAG: hypothetical protein AB1896_13400 [Thermodesulfobacteriota bacterium]